MAGHSDPGFATLSVHAGAQPDPATGARATPIYQTAAFALGTSERAARLFHHESAGHVHTRLSNPTNAALEQRMAALEGGVSGITTASGVAALHLAIVTLMGTGAHIVAATSISAGSRQLLDVALRRFGVEATFVRANRLDAWRTAIRPATRLLFGASVGTPELDVLDVPAVAQIAHDAGVPLLVDNTPTTPYVLQPLAHGADLVCHAAGEFLSGHGSVVGGVLVDGGGFDWERSGKFPELSEPDADGDGAALTEESTVGAFSLRARRAGLRDFGACLGPHSAWLILQGVETLPARMDRHLANTERVVRFLMAHPLVAQVWHPLLESHPGHATAERLLKFGGRGAGAAFSFAIRGSRAQAGAFIDGLRIFSHLVGAGDVRSGAIHPAGTTHARLSDEARAGLGPATLRLSIGLEDADDLVADLGQALKAAARAES